MARKVTVVEKFYILNNKDVLTTVDIAKALGWSEIQVQNYISKLDKQEREAPQAKPENLPAPVVPSPPSAEETSKRPVVPGRNYARDKQRGVTAMTQAESEVSDEIEKLNSGKDPFSHLKGCVHRPFAGDKTY